MIVKLKIKHIELDEYLLMTFLLLDLSFISSPNTLQVKYRHPQIKLVKSVNIPNGS